MTKLFISYSRKDVEFAQKLSGSLNDMGFESWVDWNDIPPTADWWAQIQQGIESADTFLFLLSPDSIKSEVCGREIDYAVKMGKRMIPIVAREVSPNDVHIVLTKLNWIFFREQDDFKVSIKKLEAGLKTDLTWVEMQRRLQVRALEWDKRKDNSLLLRGKDLQDAELQFAISASKDPTPTDLQREYVHESRQAADRLKRIVTGISIAGTIIMAALAVFGFIQAGRATTQAVIAQSAQAQAEVQRVNAERQAEKALAGSLAAQANSIKGNDHELALLLGLEAYQRENNLLTRTTLLQLLEFSPYTRLFGYNGPVSSVAVSPDGKLIASTSCLEYSNNQCKYGMVILSDAFTNQPITKLSANYGIVNSLVFHQYDNMLMLAAGGCVSADGQNKGCTDNKGQITLWNITDVNIPSQIGDLRSGYTGLVKTIAFNHDGTLLASGSFDTQIILWDLSDLAKPIMAGVPLRGHTSFVNSVAFSSDGNTLASAGDDKRIILWDVSQPANVSPIGETFEQHIASVNSIAFSPDGVKFASASDDDTVFLWDWDSLSRDLRNPMKMKGEGHSSYVKSIAFNADGTLLASAGFDNRVILWNAITGEQVGLSLRAHTRVINTVVFGVVKTSIGRDMPYLLSGSDDRTVIKWNLLTRLPISYPLAELSSPQGIGGVAASGDLKASVVYGQQILISGISQPLMGHTGTINSLVFSQQIIDGRLLLASASDDQTVILWDVSDISNVTEFLKLESFDSPINTTYFVDKQLITIEKSGHSIRWTVAPSDWIMIACNVISRNLTTAEWERFLPNQTYRKTCKSNP